MRRVSLISLTTVALLMSTGIRAQANDLIDFLKAVQQISQHRNHSDHVSSRARGGVYDGRHRDHGLSSRDVYKQRLAYTESLSRLGYGPALTDRSRIHEPIRGNPYSQRSNLYAPSVRHVTSSPHQYGVNGRVTSLPYTPVPEIPVQVAPAPGRPYVVPGPPQPPVIVAHTGHQIGEIVDCPVQLETCIRIKDPDHIAPGAIPTVVAVRDPHLCRHKCKCCAELVVYVEVCLPPCPPRKIRISPCGTYVCMNYGKYQVELTSRNDLITIDYDD